MTLQSVPLTQCGLCTVLLCPLDTVDVCDLCVCMYLSYELLPENVQ